MGKACSKVKKTKKIPEISQEQGFQSAPPNLFLMNSSPHLNILNFDKIENLDKLLEKLISEDFYQTIQKNSYVQTLNSAFVNRNLSDLIILAKRLFEKLTLFQEIFSKNLANKYSLLQKNFNSILQENRAIQYEMIIYIIEKVLCIYFILKTSNNLDKTEIYKIFYKDISIFSNDEAYLTDSYTKLLEKFENFSQTFDIVNKFIDEIYNYAINNETKPEFDDEFINEWEINASGIFGRESDHQAFNAINYNLDIHLIVS